MISFSKYFLATCLLFSVAFLAQAQRNKKKKTDKPAAEATTQVKSSDDVYFDYQQDIFRKALKYGDGQVAKTALYNMMAAKPEQTNLKDSLALLYYNTGSYLQTVLLSREILENQPTNYPILEVKAVSERQLGLLKESLEDYETLYKAKPDANVLYEIGSLQFQLKRYGELDQTVNALLQSKDLASKKVSIAVQKGQSQQVPLEAAAYNMRGVLATEINKPEAAITSYQKALEIYPEFVLAKSNLDMLKQRAAQQNDKKEKK